VKTLSNREGKPSLGERAGTSSSNTPLKIIGRLKLILKTIVASLDIILLEVRLQKSTDPPKLI
jgi:hypothetical protein